MKRTIVFCIAVLAMISAFVSCKNEGPQDVSALVTLSGEPAGLVISYPCIIDKKSVGLDTYSVDGHKVGRVFASKVNPFLENKGEEGVSYVVVLLKAGGETTEPSHIEIITEIKIPDVSIRQVKEIKTVEGKPVPAWKGSVKATKAFPINGGLIK